MKRAILAIAAAAFLIPVTAASAADDVMVVFDGSNSMWGQIDGTAKIEIARDAMESLMGEWTESTNIGLMAYGHRREGDCSDIETLIEPGRVPRNQFLERVRGIVPRGKTPLTSAVEQAAEALSYRDNPATVVLISDGIESCNRNPCELADTLEKSGVAFTAHVIGFGLGEEEQASLSCIAERTGGRFIAAGNAGELNDALGEVSTAVASAPEPEPEPEPVVDEAGVEVTAPATVTQGAQFDIGWSEVLADRDIVTIVPAGADEDQLGNYLRVRDNLEGELTAPADTGLYQVRYVREEGRTVAGQAAIEVVEADVTVSGPETATAGEQVDVSWSAPVAARDIVTIVPAGADEGELGNYLRVRDNTEGELTAPSEPGLYEVRYVLEEGRKTLASSPIELIGAEVTVSGPETAMAGQQVEVSWSAPVAARDIVTIVPAGADEGDLGNYLRVRDNTEGELTAPSEPGLYEVRYVLEEGRRTLASSPIELTDAEMSVSGPDTAMAGQQIEVSWSTPVAARDIVTIVPAGADEGNLGNYLRVRDNLEGDLIAPSAPGLYELRYVLDEGRRTMAAASIELVEPQIEITATETVRAGEAIEINWIGQIPNARDIVTVVPLGAGDSDLGEYKRVREQTSATLTAPEETGMYEVRYVLDEGRRTVASTTIEIVDQDAALDTGGSLDVPDTAAPGDTVQVSWTSSSASDRQRIALARRDQADFTWIDAKPTDNEPPLTFTMPDEAGSYEFRLLDLAGPSVLSRAVIEVR